MARPQLENGYIRIANDLFESIFVKAHLTQRQLIVIAFIIRQTYGYNHKKHDMSYQFISNGTGIEKRDVIRVVMELESKKMIIVDRSRNRNIIGINKDFDKWELVVKSTTSKNGGSGQFEQEIVVKSTTSGSGQIDHRKKDRLLKTEERKTDIYAHFDFLWSIYPRKLGKSSVTKKALEEVEKNAEDVRRAIERYTAEIERQHTPEKYVMYGSTFFNGRWKDFVSDDGDPGTGNNAQCLGGDNLE